MIARTIVSLTITAILVACGGATPTEPKAPSKPVEAAAAPSPSESSGPACTRPIERPGDVWQRVEEARALPEQELARRCGLDFVAVLSEWRPPPVDLLRPIVLNEQKNKNALVAWVTAQTEVGKKAGVYAAAMDIIGDWRIGGDTAPVTARAAAWQPLAGRSQAIETALAEVAAFTELLSSLSEIHALRCALEVNPLGFAEQCTPIHPARGKIDLSWQEEIQDGLFQKVALTKCKGSPSCKKLKVAAADFAAKYQDAKRRAESLQTDVFKEQALEWLKLPPFSKGTI